MCYHNDTSYYFNINATVIAKLSVNFNILYNCNVYPACKPLTPHDYIELGPSLLSRFVTSTGPSHCSINQTNTMFRYPSLVILVSVVVLITSMLAYSIYSGLHFNVLKTSADGKFSRRGTVLSSHADILLNSTFGVQEFFNQNMPQSVFSLQCVLFLSLLLHNIKLLR